MLTNKLNLRCFNSAWRPVKKYFGTVIGSEPDRSDPSFKVIIIKINS